MIWHEEKLWFYLWFSIPTLISISIPSLYTIQNSDFNFCVYHIQHKYNFIISYAISIYWFCQFYRALAFERTLIFMRSASMFSHSKGLFTRIFSPALVINLQTERWNLYMWQSFGKMHLEQKYFAKLGILSKTVWFVKCTLYNCRYIIICIAFDIYIKWQIFEFNIEASLRIRFFYPFRIIWMKGTENIGISCERQQFLLFCLPYHEINVSVVVFVMYLNMRMFLTFLCCYKNDIRCDVVPLYSYISVIQKRIKMCSNLYRSHSFWKIENLFGHGLEHSFSRKYHPLPNWLGTELYPHHQCLLQTLQKKKKNADRLHFGLILFKCVRVWFFGVFICVFVSFWLAIPKRDVTTG